MFAGRVRRPHESLYEACSRPCAGATNSRIRLGDGKTELQVARERARALKDKLGL